MENSIRGKALHFDSILQLEGANGKTIEPTTTKYVPSPIFGVNQI